MLLLDGHWGSIPELPIEDASRGAAWVPVWSQSVVPLMRRSLW